MNIDLSKLTRCDHLEGEDPAETAAIRAMSEEAVGYLKAFSWVRAINACYGGIVVPGVVGVFLFNLTPATRGVDDWLWVIVGDLPPAYITTEDAPNPAAGLDAYIGEMERWVEAVRTRQPVDDLIPVNVPPTDAYADRLSKRLRLLDEMILADRRDDLDVPRPH